VVLDAEGRAVLAGQINLADDFSFQIDLSGKLPPGRFTLRAQATVNGNTLNADIQRIPVVISSSP
jgi:hypothetical protein